MAGQSKPAAAAAVTCLATTPLDMPKAWAQRRWEWPIDKTCCKIDLIMCVLSKGGGMELQKSPSHYRRVADNALLRSEEHTSELQSLMRISYAVFCLKKKKKEHTQQKES